MASSSLKCPSFHGQQRHYRGSKQEQPLREGAEQLEGLESDVAIRVIHDIRRRLAEGINYGTNRDTPLSQDSGRTFRS